MFLGFVFVLVLLPLLSVAKISFCFLHCTIKATTPVLCCKASFRAAPADSQPIVTLKQLYVWLSVPVLHLLWFGHDKSIRRFLYLKGFWVPSNSSEFFLMYPEFWQILGTHIYVLWYKWSGMVIPHWGYLFIMLEIHPSNIFFIFLYCDFVWLAAFWYIYIFFFRK